MTTRIGAALAFCMASVATAGPLAPPAGPIAGTGPTQILSIPFTITESGSYRLARDLTQEAPTPGIQIAANDVVLDLGGHSINGKGSGTDGILIFGSNVTVRNGSIINWNGSAIAGSDGPLVVEGVQMRDLGANGIAMASATALVRGCSIVNTQTNGVAVGDSSTLEDVVVWNSMSFGFAVGSDVILKRFRAINCTFGGIFGGQNCVLEECSARLCDVGITVLRGCILTNCQAIDNRVIGVSADANALMRGVIARDNGTPVLATASSDRGGIGTDDGIVTGDSSVLIACLAEGNVSLGIRTGESCRVIACMARFNRFGISAGNYSVIDASSAHENNGLGIFCGDGGIVRSCTASDNAGAGIAVNFDCTVEHCKAELNAGNGIEIRDTGCRIDSNHVAQNGAAGIGAFGVDNVIIRNVLELDAISDVGGSIIGPLNDLANPWTNFSL